MTSRYAGGNAVVYEQMMGRWSQRLARPFLRFASDSASPVRVESSGQSKAHGQGARGVVPGRESPAILTTDVISVTPKRSK